MNLPPRFYRGDLPPREADLVRVKRALSRGPLTKRGLIEATGLTQTRTFCTLDALIVRGEVSYDVSRREFLLQLPLT
ncbi:hypothetical protein FHT26_002613 [Rhizobacter sp. SG703]|nr:hypothetical protein [Rhizobacter sp. SG703]